MMGQKVLLAQQDLQELRVMMGQKEPLVQLDLQDPQGQQEIRVFKVQQGLLVHRVVV